MIKMSVNIFVIILTICVGLLVIAAFGKLSKQSTPGQLPTDGRQEDLCQQAYMLGMVTPPIPKLVITPIPQDTLLVVRNPDLEYIPIYPGSEVEDVVGNAQAHSANNEWIGDRRFRYLAEAELEQVVAFYREALTKNGWKAVNPLPERVPDKAALHAGYYSLERAYYTWTDPENRTPWHFQVDLY
jgi:hypothetical protein